MEKLKSKCCGMPIREEMWDDYYAYAPYTNIFRCSRCGERCNVEEINENNNRNTKG